MSRPMIHCPDCHRELCNLHRPQCLWCGARLTEAEFEQVAQSPGAPLPPLPMPIMPPVMGTPWFGSAWGRFNENPFLGIKRSVSPWERKLRIIGAAFFVCYMLAHLAYFTWSVWGVHRLMPPVH